MSKGTLHRPTKNIPLTAQRRYFRIEVRGQVDKGWMAAFDPISFSSSDSATMIEVLADQAALRGILNRMWDINLDLSFP
ncbi:MAG: hypothetical protein M1281_04985 [Chloroflexi bacterium]|nr:hypothetical protein [Chloroflexota bacterium]